MKKGLFFLFLLLLTACSGPRVIPDDKLAMIFRDAFLTNAYVNHARLNVDSLKIYEPVFARYGYTTEDVQYTIGNFLKRKSARLSDVVEQAINMLETEGAYYDREVAVLDTIDNASRRAMRRVIYSDSLIRVTRLKDSTKLRVTLDNIHPGNYAVSMDYLVDSLDKNPILRGGVWFHRRGQGRERSYNYTLRREREERFVRTLIADSADLHLVFDFAGFPEHPKRPSITIRNLKIEYTPPVAVAIDSFYHRQLDIRIFAEEFFNHAMPKDSL